MLPAQFVLTVSPARHHTGQALAPSMPAPPTCHFWQALSCDPAMVPPCSCSTMAKAKESAPLLGPAGVGVAAYVITGSVLWTVLGVLFLGIPALVVVDLLVNPGDVP